MKRNFVTISIVALAVAVLSSGLVVSTGRVQAQQATATPTAGAANQTPAAELTPTAELTLTTELTPTAEMTPTGVADGGTITVDGVGQAGATPDSAVIELGVQSRAVTASVALSETNTQIQSLLDALADAGVAQSDIQTQNVNLFPVYDQPENPTDAPTLAGFNATNIVRVRVRQLDDLGTLLDTAVQAGANTIQNIQFELSDPAEQLAQAREEAVNDARRKAEQLAALVGAELGEVRTVVESGLPVPVFAREGLGGGGAVPIAPGTQTVQVAVQITWQLRARTAE